MVLFISGTPAQGIFRGCSGAWSWQLAEANEKPASGSRQLGRL